MFRVLSLPLLFAITLLQAQQTWPPLDEAAWMRRGERRIVPERYRAFAVDVDALRTSFSQDGGQGIIHLPDPEGGTMAFRYWRNGLMPRELVERYPDIMAFSGAALDQPGVAFRMDLTPHGLHAMVMDREKGWWFIDPYVFGDPGAAMSYRREHFHKVLPEDFVRCSYEEVNDIEAEAVRTQQWMQQMEGQRAGDCQLRTYRLALACTGEYANFHGSNASNNNRSLALAAMVTTMNRVNAQFERDATLTMVLVPNTDDLIFLSPSSDPYSNTNGGQMLGQNQTTCDNIIGSANYDIGHVFSTGGGGVAYLNSPCNNGLKAGGVTGQPNPVGDPFDIDYVAHEMGHQYGGNHTQNNACNRASVAAYEPGSASTIMGYAGICSPNVQSNSDPYFHAFSMQEMAANVTVGTSSSCPQTNALINLPPTVSAGPDHAIPFSTPFVLTATGSDPDMDQLTYCWEQMNNQVSTQPPQSTSTVGPNFRSLLPTTDTQRWFPALPAVVAGQSPTWEVLSSVGRTFNFRVTARDDKPDGGCSDEDNMVITVAANAGPFLVTQPNTNVSWEAGTLRTVTWDVAGTTASPVSCANVDILLSVDGGFTYPFTLATATPNDGSQQVQLPLLASTVNTARIMVRGSGNVFYDISNSNFTINAPSVPSFVLEVQEPFQQVCKPEAAIYQVQTTSIASFAQPITLGVTGLPGGLTASFSTNPVTPGATSTLTISGTASQAPGTLVFDVTGSALGIDRTVSLTLEVREVPGPVSRVGPVNGAFGVDPGTALEWAPTALAEQYALQIATDPDFNDVVESGIGITSTSYIPGVAVSPVTTYYWNVQAVNGCGFGPVEPAWSFTTTSCIPVTVEITIDRYGDETTWELRTGSTVVASGGPYARLQSNGTQAQPSVDLCLPTGCYELVVFDSFGDGNCCLYGNGFIRVVDGEGAVLANVSSNDFGQEDPAVVPFCVSANVALEARVWLDGPFRPLEGRMTDDLRVLGLLPTVEPYSALGFAQWAGGGGESFDASLLSVTGDNAIVDWVRLELRRDGTAGQVVASRQALLQRDGDIVDTDGVSPVVFNALPDNYHVAVRHRNHLGCMTASAIALDVAPTVLDLRAPATGTFGNDARRISDGQARLWSGNVVVDGRVAYTGQENDRDPILGAIGGVVPTNTTSGYRNEDVNLDGVVKYTGEANDRDPILQVVGGVVPTSIRFEQIP